MTAVMNGHAPIGAETVGSALSVARDRSERIRRGMESFIATRREVAAAYAARDWATLGYKSFEAYIEGEFSETRLKLTPDERREAVAEMRIAGMSQRAIGSALGVSQSAVRNDLAQLSTSTQLPDTVIGTDGKERPATRPEGTPKPDLAPTILAALAGAGRDGLDLKAINAAFPEPPAEKDLLRALDKLTKTGEVVVTATWAAKKPRKRASAAVVGDLTPDVLRVLAEAGAGGALAFRVAFLVDNAARPVDLVTEILHRLAATGAVTIVGTVEGGNLWALTELLAANTTETPGPVEADDAPSADPGIDYQTDPAARIADVAAVAPNYVRPVEPEQTPARRSAARLVADVTGMVDEIVTEPDVITAELVATLRKQVDRLEQLLGGAA